MCLSVVAKIEEVMEDGLARANINNVRKIINLGLLEGDVGVGDMVLIHTGFAITKIDEKQARQILEAYRGNLVD